MWRALHKATRPVALEYEHPGVCDTRVQSPPKSQIVQNMIGTSSLYISSLGYPFGANYLSLIGNILNISRAKIKACACMYAPFLGMTAVNAQRK